MKVLRLYKVEEKTGFGHSFIYDQIAKGIFPRPVKLSAKAVGWIESEVDEWIEQRIAERDQQRRNPHAPAAA